MINENNDEFIDFCNEICKYYIMKFPLEMMNENYEKIIIDEIYDNYEIMNITLDKSNNIKIKNNIKKNVLNYLSKNLVLRCNGDTYIDINFNDNKLKEKIFYLKNVKQPKQKTEEWYQFRYNHLTASNLWKIFSTDNSRNQLIYEKCLPLNTNKYKSSFNETPMSWGHKYEDVSIKYYEKIYNTRIRDYGCIPHNTYSFLAASPDGINDDETNPRYGRMLEIKNIVNRKITGIPKKEYWVQMQLQMAVCDLDECDFLETRFIEYENYDNFVNDGLFNKTKDGKQKGIIIYFIDKTNQCPLYEYMDLDLNEEEYKKWFNEIVTKKYNDINKYEWFKNIYWKLDEISCVLVKRNKLWFEKALPEIVKVWDIIVKERQDNSYHKRAPKKKQKQKMNYKI